MICLSIQYNSANTTDYKLFISCLCCKNSTDQNWLLKNLLWPKISMGLITKKGNPFSLNNSRKKNLLTEESSSPKWYPMKQIVKDKAIDLLISMMKWVEWPDPTEVKTQKDSVPVNVQTFPRTPKPQNVQKVKIKSKWYDINKIIFIFRQYSTNFIGITFKFIINTKFIKHKLSNFEYHILFFLQKKERFITCSCLHNLLMIAYFLTLALPWLLLVC